MAHGKVRFVSLKHDVQWDCREVFLFRGWQDQLRDTVRASGGRLSIAELERGAGNTQAILVEQPRLRPQRFAGFHRLHRGDIKAGGRLDLRIHRGGSIQLRGRQFQRHPAQLGAGRHRELDVKSATGIGASQFFTIDRNRSVRHGLASVVHCSPQRDVPVPGHRRRVLHHNLRHPSGAAGNVGFLLGPGCGAGVGPGCLTGCLTGCFRGRRVGSWFNEAATIKFGFNLAVFGSSDLVVQTEVAPGVGDNLMGVFVIHRDRHFLPGQWVTPVVPQRSADGEFFPLLQTGGSVNFQQAGYGRR